MFGYVRPLKAELKVKHYEQYQAAYCGLCRTLGKRFGFAARFTVSYDLVFLYLLLGSTACAPEQERCRCPAKPWKMRSCVCSNAALDAAAALNVILSFWKLDDAIEDEGVFKALAARLGKLLLRRAYLRAAAVQPELDVCVQDQLRKLHKLEAERCPSMDAYADAFACILRAFGVLMHGTDQRRAAEELLYHVGRYLYLVDALDDLPRDIQKKRINPLVLRFQMQADALCAADKQYLLESIELSLDRAAAALELLSRQSNAELLENIIYLGLPAMLKAVADGTLKKKKQE